MEFLRLFVHFNDCSDSSRIEISNKDKITIHSSPMQRIKTLISGKINDQTVKKVTNYIKNWNEYKKLSTKDKNEVLSELNAIQLSESNRQYLTVGKVREIYRKVISKQLSGFEKIACEEEFSKRVIATEDSIVIKGSTRLFNISTKEERAENAKTIKIFKDYVYKKYGQQRINRVLKAHHINFNNRIEKGRALQVEDIHNIITGLVDLHSDDVQDFYKQIKMNTNLDHLPETVRKRLSPSIFQEFADYQNHKGQLPEQYTDLPPDLIKNLINAIAIPVDGFEKHLLGNRAEGVTQGHHEMWSPYRYIYSKHYEDLKKIQAYQEIAGHKDNNELFYIELWTKLLIKNEGSAYIDNLTNMIIPALNGEWYRINKKESEKGKFVLCLDSITNPALPSLIIQRSTASSPSQSNTAWTLLQDSNPLAPPGYYDKKVCLESEFQHFMKGTNPLIITGHSLGGSFSQLNLINFLKKLEKDKTAFPNREIKLVLFDSPAITEEDADYFANWASQQPEDAKKITIEYYISKADKIPGAGKFHLGVGCEDTNVRVKFSLLNPKPSDKTPELQTHPHGRFFFRSPETIKNSVVELHGAAGLKAYDEQTWRFCMEIFRRVVGLALFPLIGSWIFLKHLYKKGKEIPFEHKIKAVVIREMINLKGMKKSSCFQWVRSS